MKTRSICRKCTLWREEGGSYTIEAALLLPAAVVLVACAAFLFAASTQAGLVYLTASTSADRVAAHWTNSAKHPVTGMFYPLQADPLYWRWNQDGGSDWFLPIGSTDAETVSLPSASDGQASTVRKKLAGAAYEWPSAYRGTSKVEGHGWSRSVIVDASVPLSAPGWAPLPSSAAGRSGEGIADPAEYIRNIEMVLGYIPRIKPSLELSNVQKTLAPWLDKQEPVIGKDRNVTFATHPEAARYTRSLVRGREKRINTAENGKWRLIDALDSQNIAHQTYIGPKSTNKDVTDQLKKDAELLRDGKVSGVVWHFFRRTGESSAGPSPSLRRMLERHGIVIVIHS